MQRFATLYADPPWPFKVWSEKGKDRSAERHYDILSVGDIMRFPIGSLAADDCALFLWCTNPMLQQALDVMAAWGFAYKTVAFVWAKTTKSDAWHMGLGFWTRANAELCLLGTRGKPKRLARDVRQLVIGRRREHSRKPEEVYGLIERLVPGPYAELFARQTKPGWTAFGDELDRFAPAYAKGEQLDLEDYLAGRLLT
jgi:N6-adenosine-specific RNA methylase IME4